MRDSTIKPGMEAYLRLNRARCNTLFRAIGVASGLSVSECKSHHNAGPVGGLAELTTTEGSIICLHVSQQMHIGHCHAPGSLLLSSSGGEVFIAPSGGALQLLDVPTWVCPKSVFDLRLSENSQLFIMKPAYEPSVEAPSPGTHKLSAMAPFIERYLENLRFYIDDAHAKALTRELFGRLASVRAGSQLAAGPCATPSDWRLLRILEKIEQNPSWEFNLQELARYSGASERNLYYLMKRNTGMTPYRYFQRHHLIRVRRQLVDCQAGEPHISRYAADEGFSHLGRFASLYREHFGELPSETIRCCQHLCGAEIEAGELTCEELVPA